jgi:maltose alpha-D-glucosyltransferase/alpha-amylase
LHHQEFTWPGEIEENPVKLLQASIAHLLAYIKQARWFRSKGRVASKASILDSSVLRLTRLYVLLLVRIVYDGSEDESYYFPIVIQRGTPPGPGLGLILSVKTPAGTWSVRDAFTDDEFNRFMMSQLAEAATITSERGAFKFRKTDLLAEKDSTSSFAVVKLVSAEQSNTSVIYDQRFIVKHIRKVEWGVNPEVEVLDFLNRKTGFRNFPLLAGFMEYQAKDTAVTSVAQQFVPNLGDGWQYFTWELRRFLSSIGDSHQQRSSEIDVRQSCKDQLDDAHRLGEITGEMHSALASDSSDEAFRPRPIVQADIEEWASTLKRNAHETVGMIGRRSTGYPSTTSKAVDWLLHNESLIPQNISYLQLLIQESVNKIRVHGDYHLGQVLRTSNDFVIFDFEGEPARSLQYRRSKFCALKDVAGMLRSFDYAFYATLFELCGDDSDAWAGFEEAGLTWKELIGESFLAGYFGVTLEESCGFLPYSEEATRKVLKSFLIEKAIYELNYEVNNRPDWIRIPLQGIRRILDQ